MKPGENSWIEDDADVIGHLFDLLKREEFIIHELRTKTEAIENTELLRKSDLIVVDIILPEGQLFLSKARTVEPDRYTGLQILKAIKEQKIDTPIIVLTVVSRPEVLEQIKNMGIGDDCIYLASTNFCLFAFPPQAMGDILSTF